MIRWIAAVVIACVAVPVVCAEGNAPSFSVVVSPQKRTEPVTGRLVIYLIREGARVSPGTPPASGPFFEDPQPIFGVDVSNVAPGTPIIVDDNATSFPTKLSQLPKGRYVVQAVMDMARLDSSWRREAGNMYSQPMPIEINPDTPTTKPFEITVNEIVFSPEPRPMEGLEMVKVRSELLSTFRGTEVLLRAAVVKPLEYDPTRAYPAIYVVPGFGGTHTMAYGEVIARRRAEGADVAHNEVWRNAFTVVLNPEGPNGHHLFVDSANNGPVGTALVTELIPEIEKKFNLIAQPAARITTGHSSGGWSSLWLVLSHPDTFGACWSSSPDPVDFRSFQRSNLYDSANWYVHDPATDAGALTEDPTSVGPDNEVPSYRQDGRVVMTVRQENAMEEVLGPGNTSGQQWDSWAAAFGPRDGKSGAPAALYDTQSGEMNPRIAEQWKRFDIAMLLRNEPEKFAPLLRERVHLLVGGADNYYLNEAVLRLTGELEHLAAAQVDVAETTRGYITIVPGLDHSSILTSPQAQEWPAQIASYLRQQGFVKE